VEQTQFEVFFPGSPEFVEKKGVSLYEDKIVENAKLVSRHLK